MEYYREDCMSEESPSLESRITAGPITDLIARELVQREGFIGIFNFIEKLGDGEYSKSFYFQLDNGDYYDEISAIVGEDEEACLLLSELNRGLNEGELYIAHFKPIWPPYKSGGSNEKIVQWVYGAGDLYSDKDITVDETGKVFEISISGV